MAFIMISTTTTKN